MHRQRLGPFQVPPRKVSRHPRAFLRPSLLPLASPKVRDWSGPSQRPFRSTQEHHRDRIEGDGPCHPTPKVEHEYHHPSNSPHHLHPPPGFSYPLQSQPKPPAPTKDKNSQMCEWIVSPSRMHQLISCTFILNRIFSLPQICGHKHIVVLS